MQAKYATMIYQMNKILLLGLWPVACITTLSAAILFSSLLPLPTGSVKGAKTAQNVELRTGYQLFTALPPQNTISESLTVQDARVAILEEFLKKYDSPLVSDAKLLVDTAEKHHLDFRLLPAVAMQESNLCQKIPNESYNCWGYGIYGDKVLRFSSYEEAIEKVAEGLSTDYIHDGLTTPELIMSRYTPSSNGSWAEAVRHFMEEME